VDDDGDLDGDGRLDIASTDRLQDSRGLTRWESDGAGGVGPRVVDGAAGSIPSTLEAGDVNGDLRPDLAYAGAFTSTAYFALANPDGSFGQQQSVPQISGRLTGLAVGDFDEDGHLDAFGSDTFAAKVAFARGHGDGSFDPLVTTATPNLYNRLVAGQFDIDSHLDVFGLRLGSTSIAAVFKGHGDGTFDAPVEFSLPAAAGNIPVAADVDDDGDLDVAVPCPAANGIAVFEQGPTVLAAPVTCSSIGGAAFVRYADLNGDNLTDRVVSGSGQWWVELGNGVGGYITQPGHAQSPNPGDLALADFDGDGRLDVAVAQFATIAPPGLVHVWRGHPGGAFDSESIANLNYAADPTLSQPPGLVSLFAQDFDQDGKVDLAGRSGDNQSLFVAAHGGGDRTFGAPEAYSAPTSTGALVPGDFDEDGYVDFLGSGFIGNPNPTTTITFVRNIGAGVLAVPRPGRGASLAITALAPNPSRGRFALALEAARALTA
jgi:hypothetical protein